ncbi:MAG: heparinase II/III domain-containing protein [Thermoanaerobaculia bacterium]
MPSIPVIARTLRRLNADQIAMRAWSRVGPGLMRRVVRTGPTAEFALPRVAEWAAKTAPWSRATAIAEAQRASEGTWSYIGRTLHSDALPLNIEHPSRLWSYEFHYRRWLEGLAHLAARSDADARRLEAWWRSADEDADAGGPAWEPYVLARRLWCEATAAGLTGNSAACARISHSVAVLGANAELHLGANHLLADRATLAGITLLLAAEAPTTIHRVIDYLEELDRQIDADGLHEERSPAYHLIALHDLKRVVAAAEVAERRDAAIRFKAIESRATAALSKIIHPDGTLPTFHDSVPAVAPDARNLEVIPDQTRGGYDLRRSGLAGWRGELAGAPCHLIADYGAPRPSHQPGHQHAAPFAFELWWGGPVITGRGVSTYEANAERLRERGAAAHSCLTIDGQEPAEIWSAFRMGRGYDVTNRRVLASTAEWCVSGAHDGYRGRLHHRVICLNAAEGRITVSDQIEGSGRGTVDLHLPIAPGWRVAERGLSFVVLHRGDDRIEVRFSGFDSVASSPVDFYKRFGEAEPGTMVVATTQTTFPSNTEVVLSLSRTN